MPLDAAQMWTLNQRLLSLVLYACTDQLDELGIETKEFFVLAEVADSPHPAHLAQALMIPKASVTGYVRNLVGKGLLRREIDDEDLRRHRLVLTPAGEQARDDALRSLAAEFNHRLTRIPTSDRKELRRILLALVEGTD